MASQGIWNPPRTPVLLASKVVQGVRDPPRATRTFLKSRARGASGTPQGIQTLVLYETLNYLVAGTEAP